MLEPVVDRVRTSTLQLDTSKERNALDWNREGNNVTEY